MFRRFWAHYFEEVQPDQTPVDLLRDTYEAIGWIDARQKHRDNEKTEQTKHTKRVISSILPLYIQLYTITTFF